MAPQAALFFLHPAMPTLKASETALLKYATTLPDAYPEPFRGHPSAKVNKKAFAMVTVHKNRLYLTLKLPDSAAAAVTLPFADPHHMFGANGWVTAQFDPEDDVPLPLLCRWIDESYAAFVPKKKKKPAVKSPKAKSGRTAKR